MVKNGLETMIYHESQDLFRNNQRTMDNDEFKFAMSEYKEYLKYAENEGHRKICMINTHLDFKIPSIQIRQLDAIKKLVQKYDQDYDVILTGDFNMQVSDKRFASFINDVKDQIKHVDIASSTWHGKHGEEATLDHIFIPKDYKIENAGTIDSNGISDHDAIFADIKKR